MRGLAYAAGAAAMVAATALAGSARDTVGGGYSKSQAKRDHEAREARKRAATTEQPPESRQVRRARERREAKRWS